MNNDLKRLRDILDDNVKKVRLEVDYIHKQSGCYPTDVSQAFRLMGLEHRWAAFSDILGLVNYMIKSADNEKSSSIVVDE